MKLLYVSRLSEAMKPLSGDDIEHFKWPMVQSAFCAGEHKFRCLLDLIRGSFWTQHINDPCRHDSPSLPCLVELKGTVGVFCGCASRLGHARGPALVVAMVADGAGW